jgi:hypothetical protein
MTCDYYLFVTGAVEPLLTTPKGAKIEVFPLSVKEKPSISPSGKANEG